MEENKKPTPVKFDPDQARREMEEKRAAKEADKIVRDHMRLAIGCEEMDRIVNEILVPEFVELVQLMRSNEIRAEVVAFDAENPIYEGEMCDIGLKFRCGDEVAPCKMEFMADPNAFEFGVIVRNPEGELFEETWSYQSIIPRRVRKLLTNFLDKYFPQIGYTAVLEDFDAFDEGLQGPFRVELEEDGETSEVASTETMEEAIKMGASFSKMFKGKPMHIVDKKGVIVC